MPDETSKPGILFIISAPSGAGKTTLIKALTDRNPELSISISHTTRPPRPGETDGTAYHFISKKEFDRMVEENIFLEHARVFDYHYGTSRTYVEEQLAAGYDVLLEIDWQGARQVRELTGNNVSLFILPPSFQTLEQRLDSRGESKATVKRRMVDAGRELSHYDEYDYLVINRELDTALLELESIIKATRSQYRLQRRFFDKFIGELMAQAGNIQ
jgi:guanylate kinase